MIFSISLALLLGSPLARELPVKASLHKLSLPMLELRSVKTSGVQREGEEAIIS